MTKPGPLPSLRANFAWLLAERGWRVVVGLFVNVLVTRHLAPHDFGQLSFAFSLNAILGSLVSLGIDDVLARELVRHPGQARQLLRTSLGLKVTAAAGSFALALLITWLFRPGDGATLGLVAWMSAGLFFLPTDVVELWYQSRQSMRPPALVRQIALGMSALARVILVFTHAPLWTFAAAVPFELALVALGLGGLWLSRGAPETLATEGRSGPARQTRRLLAEGFPLLLSGFLVVVTMQSDRLLLARFAGERAVGLYAAAARMTEMLYILPVALGGAFLPQLSGLHGSDPAGYARAAQKAALALVGTTLAIAAGVSLTAPFVIPLLLGEAYRAAANLWTIHIWMLVMVSIVSLRSRLWVVEGRTAWILAISAGTAIVDVAANCWLIPRMGPAGSAWAGVIAWSASAFVFPWCSRNSARSMKVWWGLAKPA